MIEYDFSSTNLLLEEKWKLFMMRFRRNVPASFLGNRCEPLRRAGFVAQKTGTRDGYGGFKSQDIYNLTDK